MPTPKEKQPMQDKYWTIVVMPISEFPENEPLIIVSSKQESRARRHMARVETLHRAKNLDAIYELRQVGEAITSILNSHRHYLIQRIQRLTDLELSLDHNIEGWQLILNDGCKPLGYRVKSETEFIRSLQMTADIAQITFDEHNPERLMEPDAPYTNVEGT